MKAILSGFFRRSAMITTLVMLLSSASFAQVIIYTESFAASTPSTLAQVNTWIAWRTSLVALPYYKIKVTGTGTAGTFVKECTDPTICQDIALKLRTLTTAATWVDGTNTWQVGIDIFGRFGVNMSALSACDNPGYVIKPGIGHTNPPSGTSTNANWGGWGTATCGSPAQTVTIEFWYGTPCTAPATQNATGITSNSADLSWSSVSNAIAYEYVVDQNATAPSGSGTSTTGTSYTQIGLNSSTTYYLHVRAQCDPTSFSPWADYSFTTSANPCLHPTNLSYNAPTASTASFAWSPVAGSGGYEYAITPTSSHPTTGITPTSATAGSATGLTGGTTYYLHVRNRCMPTGLSDWATISFVMPECKKPNNILFSHITSDSANMLWSMMPAANLYEYVVDNSRDDPASASGANTTTGNSAHITGLTPNTKYYVHLRSLCFINDVSDWALDSFTTQFACSAPSITVLNPGTSAPTATWNAVPDAISYEYQMSSSTTPPSFGNETMLTSQIIPLPNDGKNYYVHVRTKCFSQFTLSGWATAVLRDLTTGIENVNGDGVLFTVYPNPAKDKLTVVVNKPSPDATLSLVDLSGKLIFTYRIAGSKFDADLSKIVPGLYMLKYTNNTLSQIIKISKQ